MKQLVTKNAPGFLVCLVIALIAQGIAKFFPSIGAALFAIGLGILCGNTFLNRLVFDSGTKFSERSLLEYSIVLTGATLLLRDILALGWNGLAFIACQMALTIVAAYQIGRHMGFGKKFSLLMGAGNAVCGSSAIATVSPVVEADSKDKGISITIVNVTGTILMVLLPLITGFVYQHEVLHTSAMIGGTLQSIGQVIASAQLVGGEVVETATIFKIIRIVFIVLVALVYSRVNADRDDTPLFARGEAAGTKAVKAGVPWFIIGFFLMAILHSLGVIPAPVSAVAKLVSQQFEIIALAAIGMRVKFRDLAAEGPRAMVYGVSVGACQILFALVLIRVFLG
ncbi:putative sulfate exporter family transporter [Gemmiger formicilis]|uniref:YeiH family protein n=1 Tax=Gemmiger formicilis TaxID=745368 RepID=UPI00195D8FDC|nr:putative sulfate exporter family transporter [Gemmiger formicilis]MBM6915307.1 putative sulfate exporter family transporter [Gemmiger formicilis]